VCPKSCGVTAWWGQSWWKDASRPWSRDLSRTLRDLSAGKYDSRPDLDCLQLVDPSDGVVTDLAARNLVLSVGAAVAGEGCSRPANQREDNLAKLNAALRLYREIFVLTSDESYDFRIGTGFPKTRYARNQALFRTSTTFF
jgi:hypothetical protein